MGISGLLPALKSIQVTKHLSEYSGKTIAVDAYVWLHRGVYSCATELATGKNTHKYVDYAMHRVRLLRHHKIEPYIVFDGGPLPAKKGTEKERKQKREESLAKGKAFLLQGKHSQARECFIKCIDVTPQMAYQLIKALRAESVSYVVAPYEADAQLAYLERIGAVDAILTEDSDLLVFGCQNVLFKLDAVANTVVSISRKNFGSVTASSTDTNGISLLGWSDVQFRAMTILSGCDYLPSIPGIGLKTACSLLCKWKTAERVVKAIALEGKKSIPPGYWRQFQLAEKCFLHQRIYCPNAERLVHLTAVGDDWNEDFDVYVGSDLDPTLAKSIALGDTDPATYMPMTDINTGFKPRALKPLVHVVNSPIKSFKSKGKMRESVPPTPEIRAQPTDGIMSFFGPNPIIPRSKQKAPAPVPPIVRSSLAGKASGKRTLGEVMDQDMDRKKKARQSYSPLPATQSKFFASTVRSRHSDGVVVAGPSRLHEQNKENVRISLDVGEDYDDFAEASEEDLDGSNHSILVNFDSRGTNDMDLDLDEFPDVVEQEDGYISPSPSYSKEVQDLSSPPQPGKSLSRASSRKQRWKNEDTPYPGQTGVLPSDDEDEEENSFGADIISSPVSVKRPRIFDRRWPLRTPARRSTDAQNQKTGAILAGSRSTPKKKSGIYPNLDDVPSPSFHHGPDLRSMLGEDGATELELDASDSASPPSPSPATPDTTNPYSQNPVQVVIDLDEDEEQRAREGADRAQAVMNGWRERWALPTGKKNGVQPARSFPMLVGTATDSTGGVEKGLTPGSRPMQLRRSETTVTPFGRHSLAKAPRSAPPKFTIDGPGQGTGDTNTARGGAKDAASKPRRSLLFVDAVKQTSRATASSTAKGKARQVVDLTMSDDLEDDVVFVSAPKRSKASVLSDEEVEILSNAQLRLEQFRCVR